MLHIFQIRNENHHLKENLSSARHNLDAKNLLLRSLQLQIRTYQTQRERQQHTFKKRTNSPTSKPVSTSSPARTQPSQTVHTQPVDSIAAQTSTATTRTPKQDGEEISVTDAPHPVTKVTTVATTRARPVHSNRSTISTETRNRTIKPNSSPSHTPTNNGSDHATSQLTKSSSETGTDTVEVDPEVCTLVQAQNRALNLENDRLRKKISMLNKREQRFSKGAGRNARAAVVTPMKKKGKKQKRKKKNMPTKSVTKNTKTSHQKTKNCSTSTESVSSNPNGDGTHSRSKEPHVHNAQTTQNWALRQLLAVRKCVLEVLGSILKGNEALRHRLLDLQLGSAAHIKHADIGWGAHAYWLWHAHKELCVNGDRNKHMHAYLHQR